MPQHFFHNVPELGIDKLCLACRQFWPANSEFFAPRNSRRNPLSQLCRACIAELFWSHPVLPSMPDTAFGETAPS